MSFGTMILLSFGLSMDACAVAVCKGLACRTVRLRQILLTGLWFGGFQAGMPLLGFWLGFAFRRYILTLDHWIAFGLLAFLGIKMLWESFAKDDTPVNTSFAPREMAVAAVATSIDALAVGISLSLFPHIRICPVVLLIGAITLFLSALGVGLGNLFGSKYKGLARAAGGAILIGMGIKILLEHLFEA